MGRWRGREGGREREREREHFTLKLNKDATELAAAAESSGS